MNRRIILQALAGLLLCASGYFVSHRESYDVHTVLATAGGCQMATDIYEPRSGTPLGSVVLFHGLAANKKVMTFSAQEFSNQDLRVFVPDLPGHGRTAGPFSPDRADACALALVRELAARRAILPERTILAGHSLGGAIALRAASHFPVAGVIAISPAPMRIAPGFSAEMIPFHDVPALPARSLVLTGQWEPGAIKSLAQQLVSSSADASSKYQMITGATHVSILFSSKTFSELRSWTSQLLATNPGAPFPQNMPALGCIFGIIGLSILAPPFLREMNPPPAAPSARLAFAPDYHIALLTFAIASISTAAALSFTFVPLHFVHVFQGGYLGVFLFLTGIIALVFRYKSVRSLRFLPTAPVLSSLASAILLALLFAAWCELTFYEAWLSPARWLRFLLLALLLLPAHLAEELLLGETKTSPNFPRLLKALLLRSVVYLALLLGIFVLHSGAVLLFLLLAYFVVFSVLQRLACDLVRFTTRSSAAAAVFGAILLAAFALAVFPIA